MDEIEVVGIDFGKKYAGTSVIASIDRKKQVTFKASGEKQDAEHFIQNFLSNISVNEVFIDAPLSLPGIYRFGKPYSDYFYRQADREVGGMSPLFLGAMTARAIRLKDQLQEHGIKCREAYPAQLAKTLGLGEFGYKGQKAHLSTVANKLINNFQLQCNPENIHDWHHIDALLTALSGHRYRLGLHQQFGNEQEGLIVV